MNPTDSSVFYLSASSVLGPRLLLDDAIAAEASRGRVREKGSVDDPDGSVISYFQVQQGHVGTPAGTRATGRQDVVPLGRVGVHLPQHQSKEFTYCNVKENAWFLIVIRNTGIEYC